MMEHENDADPIYNRCFRNGLQRLVKRTERDVNWRTNRVHSNYSITKIGQNAETSHGVLRRLPVTQIPLKDNQLTLV